MVKILKPHGISRGIRQNTKQEPTLGIVQVTINNFFKIGCNGMEHQEREVEEEEESIGM